MLVKRQYMEQLTPPLQSQVNGKQPEALKQTFCEERQHLLCTFSEIMVSYLAEFDLTETGRQEAHACYLGIAHILKGEK